MSLNNEYEEWCKIDYHNEMIRRAREELIHKILDKIPVGRVPMVIEENGYKIIIPIPCNEFGYPIKPEVSLVEYNMPSIASMEGFGEIKKKTYYVTKPLVWRSDYEPCGYDPLKMKTYFYAWSGGTISSKTPTVNELLQITNRMISDRNENIIEEANKNKPIL